jgi:hypothetical protein
MEVTCLTDYDYEKGEIRLPFHAGIEYSVSDEMGKELLELAPDSFEKTKKAKAEPTNSGGSRRAG